MQELATFQMHTQSKQVKLIVRVTAYYRHLLVSSVSHVASSLYEELGYLGSVSVYTTRIVGRGQLVSMLTFLQHNTLTLWSQNCFFFPFCLKYVHA